MLAIAINDRSATFALIQATDQYVLSVPGISLVDASMYCGVTSMREVDKVRALSLELTNSATVPVPGLLRAIANVEMQKCSTISAGDHLMVVGEAKRFSVNKDVNELPLLSIGPYTGGYQLLRKKGIHRLGTVSGL
jgi:flavin reductase (DIM6/NTAB) family NADH-FMN oxidoreductase RutF